MGKKDKKDRRKSEGDVTVEDSGPSYEELLKFVNPISQPMASRKLVKKVHKMLKKASQHKQHVVKGLRDVQKAVRKGEKGLAIIAGNTYPIDVICHLPLAFEEKDIPYCYVPSKQALGNAMGYPRPMSTLMIKRHDDFKDLYDELFTELKNLPMPVM